MFEELDIPSEFYFDPTDHKLYLFWNDTTASPPPADVGQRTSGQAKGNGHGAAGRPCSQADVLAAAAVIDRGLVRVKQFR